MLDFLQADVLDSSGSCFPLLPGTFHLAPTKSSPHKPSLGALGVPYTVALVRSDLLLSLSALAPQFLGFSTVTVFLNKDGKPAGRPWISFRE